MAIYRRLISLVLLVAIAVTLVINPPAWATDYQGNQVSKAATLFAPEPDTKISIYASPQMDQRRTGFGKTGDAVTVLEQIGSNQDTAWNRIRFDNPPHAEGWVQGQYVALGSAQKQGSQSQQQGDNQGGRYLGKQSVTQQNRPQTYAQQNQQ